MDTIDLKDGHATPKFWVLVNYVILEFRLRALSAVQLQYKFINQFKINAAAIAKSALLFAFNCSNQSLTLTRAPVKVKLNKSHSAKRPEGRACLTWRAAPPATLRVAGAPEGCRFAAAGPNNVRQGRAMRAAGQATSVVCSLAKPFICY